MVDNASSQQTSPPEVEWVGTYLQRERLSQQKTLKEVAEATCIHVGTLQALEEEDKAKLPAEVFVRGFITIYARHLGLDPQEALNRYGEKSTAQAKWVRPGGHHETKKLTPRKPPLKPAAAARRVILAVLVLGLAGLAAYWSLHTPRPPQPATLQQAPTAAEAGDAATVPEPVAEREQPQLAPAPAAPPPEAQNPAVPTAATAAPEPPVVTLAPDSQPRPERAAEPLPRAVESATALPAPGLEPTPAVYVLEAEFLETTWVQSQVDDKPPQEFTFQPGERYTWKAQSGIKLFLGNAGGAELTLNDQPLPPPGKSGQTARISLPEPP